MNKSEAEKYFKKMGLVTENVKDKSGQIYSPHRHEKTILLTLNGSVRIKTDTTRDWVTLDKNYGLFTVGSNELHEAIVENDGWEYIAAWDGEEAKKYKHQ